MNRLNGLFAMITPPPAPRERRDHRLPDMIGLDGLTIPALNLKDMIR